MSSESDSEVFFDAEEGTTPVRNAKTKNKSAKIDDKVTNSSVLSTEIIAQTDFCNVDTTFISVHNSDTANEILPVLTSDDTFPVIQVSQDDVKEVERKARESERRRKKIEELRNRMLTDDEDIIEIPSEQSSLTSSVDGIFPRLNSLNADAFPKSTDESLSVLSLGNVGLILGEKDTACYDPKEMAAKEPDSLSIDSKYSVSETGIICDLKDTVFTKTVGKNPEPVIKGPEPDLVASTKGEIRVQPVSVGSTITDHIENPPARPVVPPRRKKKTKPLINPAQTPTDISESSDVPETSSPTDMGDNLSREFECFLDINSATRGQYVVKPQDQEQNRGKGPSSSQLLAEADSVSISESVQPSPSSSIGRKGSSKRDLKEDAPSMVRVRTDSGRPLTDQEILAQVKVLNLDTGEQIPLSLAEEHLPKCLNPLSLHIMRITSEYVSNTALDKERESDEESIDSKKAESLDASKVWSRTVAITKQFGRNIESGVHRIKTVVADKVHHARHPDDDNLSDDESSTDPRSNVEVKMSNKLKAVDRGRSEFDKLKLVQELSGEHTGAIWTMKFSCCGKLLATAGQDHDLRIWVLRDSFKFFDDMRQKFAEGKCSPTPSQESSPTGTLETGRSPVEADGSPDNVSQTMTGPFMEVPFCRYKGHTAELLDVSWSKNYFILSSSMDKTVRLWHISRQECLCCFQHIDFVTAIAFHPRDDRYFLSGSLDGKLRLWNIPDKKVTLWNELDGQTKLITAVNFCRNGKIAVVGSYDGRCIFYNTDQLKYYTQIHVRSSRGKNRTGRKISGIEAMPGEDKILVTSNDSRIRLYDFRDLSLSCKYKGYTNQSSQIKASFSHDGRYIISGSENQFIYLWKTSHDYAKFSRRDRNDYWERIKAHNAGVTSAVFAPNPLLVVKQLEHEEIDDTSSSASTDVGANSCYVIVSADFTGTIKVFLQKSRGGLTSSS